MLKCGRGSAYRCFFSRRRYKEIIESWFDMTGKRRIIIVLVLLIIVLLSAVLIYEDKNLEINTYEISSLDLPEEFNGFRIAHISDLHNAEFIKGNEKLISMLRDASPDIIAITGDIIDSRRTDVDISFEFVQQALEIAPCYYVTGNHEARVTDEYAALKERMAQVGVIILENDSISLECEGAFIEILGLEDPTFAVSGTADMEAEAVARELGQLATGDDKFILLLSHRPEFFDVYAENDIDLVLSGHAHGGQFVLPFVGGFIAPGQGFFPEYDSGLFRKDGTTMFVSRGIGNSIISLRINNRPEIILIELHSEDK